MASGVRRTRRCSAYIDTVAYRLNDVPSNYMCTMSDNVPGAGYTGAYQPGHSSVGAQWFQAMGLGVEMRARDQAVGALATDELWCRMLNAGGCVRATGGTNALPHTYTLGDIHGSTDTPAGETQLLAVFGLQIDGTAAGSDFLSQDAQNCVTNWSLSMIAGQKPMFTFDVYGNLQDATTTTTNLTLQSQIAYGTEGTAIAWYNSSLTLTASGLSAHTPVLRSYTIGANNVIPVRFDANGPLGVAPMQIIERAPAGTLVFEAAHGSSIATKDNPDHWWRNGLYFDMTSTIELGAVDTAGGSITANTATITQRAYVSAEPTLVNNNGILTWNVPWMIDEAATGANAWRISLAA